VVLMASFAAIALVLTAVGIYGPLSYAVAKRRREIEPHFALGARRRDALGMVLGRGRPVVSGGHRSGPGWCRRSATLLESIIFGVRAGAPVALLAALGALVSRPGAGSVKRVGLPAQSGRKHRAVTGTIGQLLLLLRGCLR